MQEETASCLERFEGQEEKAINKLKRPELFSTASSSSEVSPNNGKRKGGRKRMNR